MLGRQAHFPHTNSYFSKSVMRITRIKSFHRANLFHIIDTSYLRRSLYSPCREAMVLVVNEPQTLHHDYNLSSKDTFPGLEGLRELIDNALAPGQGWNQPISGRGRPALSVY